MQLLQVLYIFSSMIYVVCDVTGGVQCEVMAASENELQCVMQSDQKTHVVTNQGFDRSRFTILSEGVRLNLSRPKYRTERGLS